MGIQAEWVQGIRRLSRGRSWAKKCCRPLAQAQVQASKRGFRRLEQNWLWSKIYSTIWRWSAAAAQPLLTWSHSYNQNIAHAHTHMHARTHPWGKNFWLGRGSDCGIMHTPNTFVNISRSTRRNRYGSIHTFSLQWLVSVRLRLDLEECFLE